MSPLEFVEETAAAPLQSRWRLSRQVPLARRPQQRTPESPRSTSKPVQAAMRKARQRSLELELPHRDPDLAHKPPPQRFDSPPRARIREHSRARGLSRGLSIE